MAYCFGYDIILENTMTNKPRKPRSDNEEDVKKYLINLYKDCKDYKCESKLAERVDGVTLFKLSDEECSFLEEIERF